jgi:hypothetical protein
MLLDRKSSCLTVRKRILGGADMAKKKATKKAAKKTTKKAAKKKATRKAK